jgi:PTH1 family peptidyl-tRNA hydrolase
MAERLGFEWRRSFRFQCLMGTGNHGGDALVLLKPRTFMNLSGQAVGAVARYRGIERRDVVVVSDDADLEIGRLRIRPRGGSGGHRGLASLIESLGGDDFVRVRVGIGRRGERSDLAGHVLGRLSAEELVRIEPVYERAVEAVLCVVEQGVDAAMNRFNPVGAVPPPEDGGDSSTGDR